jgi:hypothetical protein
MQQRIIKQGDSMTNTTETETTETAYHAKLIVKTPYRIIREAHGYTVGTETLSRRTIVRYLRAYAAQGCPDAQYWLQALKDYK